METSNEEANTKFKAQINIGIVHICNEIEELSSTVPNVYDDKVIIVEYLQEWTKIKSSIDTLCEVIGYHSNLIKPPIETTKAVKSKPKFIIKKRTEDNKITLEKEQPKLESNDIEPIPDAIENKGEEDIIDPNAPRLISIDKSQINIEPIINNEEAPITIENIVKKVQEAHIEEPNQSIFSRPLSPNNEGQETTKKKDIRELLTQLKINSKTKEDIKNEQPSEVEDEDRDSISNVSQEEGTDTESITSQSSNISKSFKDQVEKTRKNRTAKTETASKKKWMSDSIDNIKKILNYYSSTIKETTHSRNQVINTLIKNIKSLKLQVYQESALIFEENIKDWIMETIADPDKYPNLRSKQVYVNKQVREVISPNVPDKETGRYVNACFSCWLLNNYLDKYKIIDRFIEISNSTEDKQKELLTPEYITELARCINQVEKGRDKCKIAYNIEMLVE